MSYNVPFRTEDIERVLFLGNPNIITGEFRGLFDRTGTVDQQVIRYGEPWFNGLLKKEKVIYGIKNDRIVNNIVMKDGRRTLLVLAEPYNIGNINTSILDVITADLRAKLEDKDFELRRERAKNKLYEVFINRTNIESSFTEFWQNNAELLRTITTLVQNKEQAPSVDVSVGDKSVKQKNKGKYDK